MTWWHDLNAPDAYRGDWYGELTNQISHTALGSLSAILWCMVAFALTGEMPVRSVVFLGIAGVYLAVEILVQRWAAGDSWFDAAMVCGGACMALLPFREAGIEGHLVILSFDPIVWAAIAGLWSVALFLRVSRRYLASRLSQ